jgi:quinol---cytochrome c reductase iron-sulfur subunit, bacillus type
MTKSPNMSRREFVNFTVGAIGTVMVVCVGIPAVAYVLGPGLKVSKSETWIPVGKVADFPPDVPTLVSFTRTTVNGWERTTNSYGVYVTKPQTGDPYVLSNVCTHLACRVTWKEDKSEYVCPCHDGLFNIQGEVVGGPPPKPLVHYPTKIEDGTLYIQV